MKENKGITLIALIVTIIVLIILAGVAIAMLRGDNGILNRATEAKYDNAVASFDEQVKLAQMAVRTSITAEMVNKPGYIATAGTAGKVTSTAAATEGNNFAKLVKQVVDELGAKEVEPDSGKTQEGFIVYSYLTKGDTETDGEGFILITYSDNALRSSLPKEINTATSYKFNTVEYKKAGEQATYSVNQAVLAYVIRVTNYNCSLSNAILTDSTARSTASGLTTAPSFCTTSVVNGVFTVSTSEGSTIGKALTF